ncbi:tyrosine-type recombinase/integrase [Methylobacterium gregans]|uniref:Tyrosine recombinase XerC n=1 Tax=Methylobacterium gregans TaxID=374424 RepID=A0AA37HTB0_9HYPH|nr:tyrosine-type recombinase/integrase [Methylobacterium gregans]MDQ0523762.1 integrase [Methylobacterium gregans]GJD81219.1 Tyrosine recombinase XerC [Methylobacterium gregans]GLS54794.1 hypothetical protein GCM10007886_29780 [Methylobacterium gregans]
MTKAKNESLKIGPFRIAPHVRAGALTGAWLIDLPPHVSPSGKRERRFVETKSAATAEAKRLLRDLQLDEALSGMGRKAAGITLAELSERWLQEQADRVATGKKRARSLESDAQRMRNLLVHLGLRDVEHITAAEIVRYQKAALEKRSPATVNAEVRLAKTLLLFAADKNLIGRAPKVEPIPEPRKRLNLPTIDEMNAILAHLPTRTGLLVRFLAETGCRKSEAFNLEWSDLCPEQGLAMIRSKDGWTPKTAHSDRDVFLAPALVQALQEAHRDARSAALAHGKQISRWVFPGRGGVRITDFEKALAAAVKQAGVFRDGKPMHITPHMLRKANATWLKQRGVDDGLLQPHLGHAPGSRVTARSYVHLPADALRATVIDLDKERRRSENGARSRAVK